MQAFFTRNGEFVGMCGRSFQWYSMYASCRMNGICRVTANFGATKFRYNGLPKPPKVCSLHVAC